MITRKHLLCIVLTILMFSVFTIAPREVQAASYNPSAAVAYARANYKNSSCGECAQFVSMSVNAGGIPAYSTLVGDLRTALKSNGFTEYSLSYNWPTLYATGNNAGKISVGDVLIYYCNVCSSKPNKHASIVTNIGSDGAVYMTQRNASYLDTIYSAGYYGCGHSCQNRQFMIYSLHWGGSPGGSSSVSINNNATTNISQTNAQINGVINNPSKLKVTSAGFYLGTSSGSYFTSKTESANLTLASIDIWYDLNKWVGVLSPGTKYYYKFFVVAGGKTYYSAESSFTTASPAVSAPSITLSATTNISQTNAQINGVINNPSKLKVTSAGFYLGTSSGSYYTSKTESANLTLATINIWYDLNKWVGTLSPGTKYYYKFFVVAGGKTYYSAESSFTTASPAVSAPSITLSATTNISQTNAQINGVINNPSKLKVTSAGFYLGTSSGSYYTSKTESAKLTLASINIWYDLNKWVGVLSPGTKYYYKFFVVANGKTYYSTESSFTTASPKVNQTSTTIKKGSTLTLKASAASNEKITWTSSNSKIATVNSSGKVTAKSSGTATITAKTKSNGKIAVYKVTVPTIKTTSIKLSNKKLTLKKGASKKLKATIKPSNATNKNITWKSSKKRVATVNSNGKIIAKGIGRATITVQTKDSKKKATCTVIVKK